jgi:hypothetical protein
VEFLETISRGKRVLHLGCTNHPYTQDSIDNGMLLHDNLSRVASELWGIDGDAESLKVLRDRGYMHLIEGDIESLNSVDGLPEFDLVIAGEIIEHVNNPGLFLNAVRSLMAPKTKLVLTTVNAYCGFRNIYYALRGKGGVAEPVHPDHVAYYSYVTLNNLLKRHSLKVIDFLYYDIGVEHRKFSRRWLLWLNDICVRLSPQLADGLIAVCTLEEQAASDE